MPSAWTNAPTRRWRPWPDRSPGRSPCTPQGSATARQAAHALLCRVRILSDRIRHTEDTAAAVTELEEAVRELLAFTEPHRTEPGVRTAVAEALSFLGNITAFRGSAEGAADLYARSAEEYVAAGRPWYAVEPESQLAGVSRHLGDLETAERASRAALEHAAHFPEPGGRARLHLQLVETLADAGKPEEAAEHALEAAHWADEAGEGTGIGAYARHKLGGFLLELGRVDESAAVLEAVLPDLTADDHGEGMIVQTLWWLGDCLTVAGRAAGGGRALAEGGGHRAGVAGAARPRDARESGGPGAVPGRAQLRGGARLSARRRALARPRRHPRAGAHPAGAGVDRGARGAGGAGGCGANVMTAAAHECEQAVAVGRPSGLATACARSWPTRTGRRQS